MRGEAQSLQSVTGTVGRVHYGASQWAGLLRRVKQQADAALEELSPTFDRMYAKQGRLSVPLVPGGNV